MGHAYNNGLHTSSKGITVDAVKVKGLDVSPGASAACIITEDCKSGLVSSVLHTATGVYEFQLSVPYPPKNVVIIPSISTATVTTDILVARYVDGSYDATTGKFTVVVSNDDDSGAPIAAAGTSANELNVLMMFNRYTR